MTRIYLLDKILTAYYSWLLKTPKLFASIEETILQNDSRDAWEEKIISVGLSTVFMSLVSSVAGAVGLATGGFLGGVALFGVGLFLSKGINKKIFGKPRSIESLNEQEKSIFLQKAEIEKDFKSITLRVKFRKEKVNFTKYPELKEQLSGLLIALKANDATSLAYKYRKRYQMAIKKYTLHLRHFDVIYANKYQNSITAKELLHA